MDSNKQNSKKKIVAVVATIVVIATGVTSMDGKEIFDRIDDFLVSPEEKSVLAPAEGDLMVTVLDVGQGDSILIKSPDKNILIDAGENDKGDEILEYLSEYNVDHLDYIIATHYHADHVGGADYIIDNMPVDKIILPDISDDMLPGTKTVESLLESITNTDTEVIISEPMMEIDIGGEGLITILGPLKHYDDTNDTSMITRIDFGDKSFLFTGDAEQQAEMDLVKKYGEDYLKADVYNAGHHGSSTSSTKYFYEKVDPDYVNISCGIDNSYGHPNEEVLQTIESNDAIHYRTDINGNITYITDGSELSVSTER